MTQLVSLSGNLPAHIAALQQSSASVNKSLLGGITAGPVLPKLSIRGKEFRFVWNGQEMSLGAGVPLEGIIVAARPSMSRRYYAEQYASGSQDAPDCHSLDGVRPDRGKDIQAEACNKCPHSVYGSKILPGGKEGFACGSYKLLVFLPLLDGMPLDQLRPMSLQLPIASVKRGKGYQGQEQFLFEYLTALDGHNVPANAVVTRLALTSAEFPQVGFSFSRYTSPEELALAQVWEQDDDVRTVLGGHDEDEPARPALPSRVEPVAAVQQETPPEPAPAPVAAPPPKPTPSPAPAAAAPPAPAPAPRGRPRTAAPPPPPAVETVASQADTMAKVRSLLAGLSKQ